MKILSAIGSFIGGIPAKVWLWIATIGLAYLGYMYWEHRIFEQGAASVQVKFDAYVAQAKQAAEKAKADHDELQAKLDATASVSNKGLSDQFKALSDQLKDLKAHDSAFKPQKPLPADCKFDYDRVSQANAALAR